MHRPLRLRWLASFALLSFALRATAAEVADVPLFDEALAVSKQLDQDTDADACRSAFKEIVAGIRQAMEAAKADNGGTDLDPKAITELLNEKILIGRDVSYISNKYWRDSLFTSALLKNRGNCASTSLLYYLVAQELKLPITMAFAPQHAFVRWDDGTTSFNIETTHKGICRTDAEVMQRFDLEKDDLDPNCFVKTLNEKQIRAHLRTLWSSVFYSLQRREEAYKFLEQARETDPKCPTLLLHQADYLMTEGQVSKAKEIFDTIAKNASGPWAKASSQLSYVYYLESRGQVDDAIKLLADNYEASPWTVKIRMAKVLGALYRQKRQYERAIPLYQFVAFMRPKDYKSFNSLGSVLSESRRNEEAIKMFDVALSLNPENWFAQLELAVLYDRIGQKENSQSLFKKIEPPRDNALHWNRSLAFYYACTKNEPKMLEAMAAAYKLDGSGDTFQYFKREEEMDPYREHDEFKKLMSSHAPETGK